MSRNSLLDFYREIVNSEKSFDIDYKNLSKQLIERIDKAIEYISDYEDYCDEKECYCTPKYFETLLEILGDNINES